MMITVKVGDFGMIIPDKCPTPSVGECVGAYGAHCPCYNGSAYEDGNLTAECLHKHAGTSPVVTPGKGVHYE